MCRHPHECQPGGWRECQPGGRVARRDGGRRPGRTDELGDGQPGFEDLALELLDVRVLADGDELHTHDFSALESGNGAGKRMSPAGRSLEQLEEAAIRDVLEKHKGNISIAARELGLTRTSLYRRVKKYEIG